MPRAYAAQFRAMVVEQVRSGRRVAEVATAVEVPPATVLRWVRQDKIDRGELVGTTTAETAELRAAKRRIAELEAELATVKRASELFSEGRVVRPKELFDLVETLAKEGHGKAAVPAPLDRPFGVLHVARQSTQPPGHPSGLATRPLVAPTATAGSAPSSPTSTESSSSPSCVSWNQRPSHPSAQETEPGEPGDYRGLCSSRLRPRRPQPALDDRHHRAPDQGRQAVVLLRARRLEPQGRGLVDRSPDGRHGACRARHGHRGASPRTRDIGSLRPQISNHLLDLQSACPLSKAGPIDRQRRRRVRQRRDREFLGSDADRAPRPKAVEDPRRIVDRHLRLNRGLLQPDPSSQLPRDAVAGGL